MFGEIAPKIRNFFAADTTRPSLVAFDSNGRITATTSSLSPSFTGLNLSGLSASSLVGTDGSSNLTTSITGLSPQFTNETLTGWLNLGTTATNTAPLQFFAGAGRKIKLYADAFTDDYQYHGFGIDSSTVTYNVPDSAHFHKFRCGVTSSTFTDLFIINGNGTVSIPGLTTTGVMVTGASGLVTAVTAVSTWTPTIGDGTNNFSTSTATGTYYKIGHVYFCQLILVWTGHGSAAGGTGVAISIPATMGANQTRLSATIGYASGVSFTGSYLTCVGGPTASVVHLYGIGNTGTPNQVTCASLATSGEIEIQFTMWDN